MFVLACTTPFLVPVANKPMQHFIIHSDELFWGT